MLILGIDPGLATTGWGVVDQGPTRLRYVAHGVLTTAARTALPDRLRDLEGQLECLLGQFKPTAASVEELFFAKNVKTAMDVSHARGVILATLARHGCAIREFTPLEIKQALTGFGRADKRQVQKMIPVILGAKLLSGPDDATDALAAAICAAQTVVMNSKSSKSSESSKYSKYSKYSKFGKCSVC